MTAAVAVREGPILMSGPMVRATLEDRKTQTRRVVRNQSKTFAICMDVPECRASVIERCSYGNVGDRLYVRETWGLVNDGGYAVDPSTLGYRADGDVRLVWPEELLRQKRVVRPRPGWRPSIHMPRWASRITLEITELRVERLQEISESDAKAEGVDTSVVDPSPRGLGRIKPKNYVYARECFADIWDSLNDDRGFGWDANPWVWVIGFRRVNVDAQADGGR